MRAVKAIRRVATIVAVLSMLKLVQSAEIRHSRSKQPAQQPPKPFPVAQPYQRAILTDKSPVIVHEYHTEN